MKTRRRFNWGKLGRDIQRGMKRGDLGLREAARQLGIHHATFCRAANGQPISVPDFAYMCAWLNCNSAKYLYIKPKKRVA